MEDSYPTVSAREQSSETALKRVRHQSSTQGHTSTKHPDIPSSVVYWSPGHLSNQPNWQSGLTVTSCRPPEAEMWLINLAYISIIELQLYHLGSAPNISILDYCNARHFLVPILEVEHTLATTGWKSLDKYKRDLQQWCHSNSYVPLELIQMFAQKYHVGCWYLKPHI